LTSPVRTPVKFPEIRGTEEKLEACTVRNPENTIANVSVEIIEVSNNDVSKDTCPN
jgi:hypothetical protein